jgi:hypothetical protein
MAIYELWMSRHNGVNATDYVGPAGKLWYDPDTQSIRSSDGTTAGGASINGGGGSTYTNTNVVNLLASFGSNSISTTGNVTATRFIGSGANLTALTGANVTGQVPFAAVANSVTLANVTGVGNIASLNITANAAQVLYGNGVFAASYANSNVTAHLAAFGSNTITTTGNITANYLFGNHLGDQQVQVTNRTGSTITAGSVVRIVGYQGGNMTVALASNSAEIDSAGTLGIVVADIPNNGVGFVQYNGTITNQNTAAFSEGAMLFLGSTPGTLTATKPDAPAHAVRIGWVRSVNANNGSIYIKVDNGYELDELHNVLISGTIANNSLLQYNSATGVWRNVTQPTFGMTIIDGNLQAYGALTTSEWNNGTSNVRIASGGNIGFSINGTGNIVNVIANGITTTGNVSAGAIKTDNLLYANGVQWPTGGSSYTNTDVVNLLSAFGSNTISTTGNITAGNVTAASLNSGTGNIRFINNNLYFSVNGSANAVRFTSTESIVTGGNINGGIIKTDNWFYTDGTSLVPGSNTQVIFNNNGKTGANPNLTFTGTVLTVTGNVVATRVTTDNLTTTRMTANVTDTVPATATDTGNRGEIRFDSNYMYVCIATNTWKRFALSTW